MISDFDIYRAANLVIERHGADAVIEAARMLELGYLEGRDPWRRIRCTMEVLQAPGRPAKCADNASRCSCQTVASPFSDSI